MLLPHRPTCAGRRAGRVPLRWLAGLLGLACVLGVSAFRPWGRAASVVQERGAPVRRGPLRISVTTSGHLKAADTVRLASGVEGRTTILWLASEGTQVKEGEVVCELDATALVERRIQQTITVGNAEAALVKASQQRAIQESQNLSDGNKAARALEFAAQDLAMFLEGERELELEKSQQSIDLAKEEAQRAQSRLTWSQELNQKGFLTATELEADAISEHRSAVTLQQASRERDLMLRFRLPRREAELRALLSEAELERQRVELQSQARLVDFDSDVRSSTAELELEREKLARLERQIERAKLRAPCDGYVVYAQRDNDDPPIGAGVEVREREEILAIPSSSGMTAEIKLHESVLKQVEIGQPCQIVIDALPGVELGGRVHFVAMLPDQNSRWSNPNLRVYRCEIEVTSQHPGLRPGMSCAVEILIEELADALYVPVQAVFRDQARTLAFVPAGRGSEPRTVRVGRYNELWVQVLEGLAEGETVLLQAPAGFVATPPEAQAESGTSGAARAGGS
jgi:HlyD family secretion protein